MSSSARSHADWTRLLAGQHLPAGLVDLDAFDRNLDRVRDAARVAGRPVRLATKSVRVPQLVRRALDRGPELQGLMCFSAREAGLYADLGVRDLLVAYPTVQGSDLAELRRIHEAGALPSLVVDSVDQARAVSAAMDGVAGPFRVLIDVDVSLRMAGGSIHLGVRRSPLHGVADVEALARELAGLPDIIVAGAMGYDAQLAGVQDRNPWHRVRNRGARAVRARSRRTVLARRAAVRGALEDAGVTVSILNGGGTGSLHHALADPALTEVTAGSALLCPHLFDYFSDESVYEPACWFALQAVRIPAPGMVTCQGGGFVASGEAGADRLPLPVSPPGARLVPAEGAGEVQTPLQLSRGTSVAIGEPVLFRHAKAGELAEHLSEYLLVSGDRVVDTAPTYRGLGHVFP